VVLGSFKIPIIYAILMFINDLIIFHGVFEEIINEHQNGINNGNE